MIWSNSPKSESSLNSLPEVFNTCCYYCVFGVYVVFLFSLSCLRYNSFLEQYQLLLILRLFLQSMRTIRKYFKIFQGFFQINNLKFRVLIGFRNAVMSSSSLMKSVTSRILSNQYFYSKLLCILFLYFSFVLFDQFCSQKYEMACFNHKGTYQ